MKKVMVVAAIGLLLSGCASTHTYVTTTGTEVETSTDMAYLMSVRDVEKTRVQAFNDSVALSDRPEQVVALVAAMFGAPGQRIERPRTWDERALPWVATLSPLLSPLLYGYVNQGGGSENVTVEGTGNSVFVSSRNKQDDSYIYPVLSSDSNYEQYEADGGARMTPGTGDTTTTITNPDIPNDPTSF